MTDDGPRPARDALGGATGAFADVLARARRLVRLQRRLESLVSLAPLAPPGRKANLVPPAGSTGVQLCGLEDGELRLLAPTAAVATQLRFRERELTAALSREAGVPLRRLVVRVRPTARPTERERPAEGNRGLPSGAAELLGALAAEESDPALRRALARLAGRTR